jgi:multiple sugar transport system substrate-binding protein
MTLWPTNRRTKTMAAVAMGLVAALGMAACGSSTSSGSGTGLSAKQTIVFATAGLGAEATATNAAISGFEKLHPNIKVTVQLLSSSSTSAQQQEQHSFVSGSSTPDIAYSDVTWVQAFAKAGWVANLNSFNINTSAFFQGQMATGEYNGGVYALPWFINAEGLYYRTDMISSPPTSEAQLVSDAQAALKANPSLKEGLAFEGAQYEGSVTVWQTFGAQIGLSDLKKGIDTPQNVQALTFMYDAIHTDNITPSAATGWQESQVQSAWQSSQAPFTVNWPYIYQLSEAKGSPQAGKTAWIPFPSPTPQASLGGDDLVMNKNSKHQAAAWAFMQYLTSASVQDARAISAGDPPSLKSAYNSTLYAAAPYYQQEQAVYNVVVSRPLSPNYTNISTALQEMISSVLSGQKTPSAALAATAPTVKALAEGASV